MIDGEGRGAPAEYAAQNLEDVVALIYKIRMAASCALASMSSVSKMAACSKQSSNGLKVNNRPSAAAYGGSAYHRSIGEQK